MVNNDIEEMLSSQNDKDIIINYLITKSIQINFDILRLLTKYNHADIIQYIKNNQNLFSHNLLQNLFIYL